MKLPLQPLPVKVMVFASRIVRNDVEACSRQGTPEVGGNRRLAMEMKDHCYDVVRLIDLRRDVGRTW